MKRLILISAFFSLTTYCFAQNGSKSNQIFLVSNSGTPREVYRLGGDPEFPQLRNLNTPQQVAAAMKQCSRNKDHLNSLLMDIGFSRGAADVTASDISPVYLPTGTDGNMGDGKQNVAYVKLMGDNGTTRAGGVRAWKVSSPTGESMYLLAKCGNSFYPYPTVKKTACVSAPLNITNASKEVTLGSDAVSVNTHYTYVYYHMKKRHRALAPQFSDLSDPTASNPVLLNYNRNVKPIPDQYRVSVSADNANVQVCDNQSLDLSANISIEKVGAYTGNYPNRSTHAYKEVSKHVYKKTARKMRHALDKEQKVARLNGETVKTEVAAR